MEIPHWLKRKLDENSLKQIEAAVTEAESHTSAEIVPMVVRGSITTGHVSWLLFCILLLILWTLLPAIPQLTGESGLSLWIWELLAVAVAGIAAAGLKDLAFIQRWLTPQKDEIASVMHRAQLEFHLSDIRKTDAHTGVLIFISLLERKAVVLADWAVAEKFPVDAWEKTLQVLLLQLKAGDLARGLSEAIRGLGVQLSEKFPVAAHEVNQLPNSLIIKE